MAKRIQYKKLIQGDHCSIVSKVVKNGFTEIDIFVDSLSDSFTSSIEGLYQIMEEYAKNGGELLTTNNCHKAHTEKEISIYEYRKGRLRVYWFYDAKERNIVVCSHGVIKSTQKTAKSDKEKAINAYRQYHNNKESIIILEDD